MATSIKAPGLGTNEAGGDVAWTSPGNITANDAFVAQVSLGAGETSDYLYATDFGFSIPSGATIDGVDVNIYRYGMGNCEDYLVRLIDDTGTRVGDNKALTGYAWPGVMTGNSYGTPSDDWSVSPTPAMVNDSNFGVALQATSAGGATAIVGYIEMTVHYSGGGVEDSPRIIQSQTSRRPLVAPTRPSFVVMDLGTEVIEAVSAWEPVIVSAGPRREGPPQRSRVILTDEKLAGAGTLPDTTPGQLPEVVVAMLRPRERARVAAWLSIVIDAGSGEVCLCPFGAVVVASRFATASLVSTLFAPSVGQRASYTADVVSDRFATAVLVSHVCSC